MMWLCGFFPSIVVIVPYLLPYEWGVMPVALYKPTKDRENLEREVQKALAHSFSNFSGVLIIQPSKSYARKKSIKMQLL